MSVADGVDPGVGLVNLGVDGEAGGVDGVFSVDDLRLLVNADEI